MWLYLAVFPENTKKLRKLVLANCKEDSSWRYQKAVYSPFCINICLWESCVETGCCVCSKLIKNNNVSTIQRFVCNCFYATKKSFCINMCQWMKHRSTTSLRSQISCQMSGKQQVKVIQCNQRRKHQQARFWPPQGILFIDYLEKRRTINSEYHIALLVHLNEEIAKKQQKIKKKSSLLPRQCTVSQIDRSDSKTIWIALWTASTPTLFSRSGPQQLLAICRSQKNAPGKEIWL